MRSITATQARSMLYNLIDEIAASHEPILITDKYNRAVLVSEEDWRAINETLYLLSIPGMRESLLKVRIHLLKKQLTILNGELSHRTR